MQFPQTLTVTVRDAHTGSAVGNVAFVLSLTAHAKNDYCVGPVIADADGTFVISNDDCRKAIRRAQEMFVMDYSGDLSTCGPTAELELHPPEHLRRMIAQFETTPAFWGRAFDHPGPLMASLKDVENSNYEPFSVLLSEYEIYRNPNIDVRIVKSQNASQAQKSGASNGTY